MSSPTPYYPLLTHMTHSRISSLRSQTYMYQPSLPEPFEKYPLDKLLIFTDPPHWTTVLLHDAAAHTPCPSVQPFHPCLSNLYAPQRPHIAQCPNPYGIAMYKENHPYVTVATPSRPCIAHCHSGVGREALGSLLRGIHAHGLGKRARKEMSERWIVAASNSLY